MRDPRTWSVEVVRPSRCGPDRRPPATGAGPIGVAP